MIDKNKDGEISKYEILLWVVAVLILWGVFWVAIDCFVYPENSDHQQGVSDVIAARGQFGDKFGAINSLFTGLAFALLIYTARLQRKDLKMQSE